VKLEPLDIADAMLVHCESALDSRGAFVTFWETSRSHTETLAFAPESAHHSFNQRAGTLRGLHFQRPPHEQAKLVTCASGRFWDVIVDLRPGSRSYMRWQGVHLAMNDGRAVFVPRGCAHGFITLKDETVVTYLIDGKHEPGAAAVVRWNDAAFGIEWPVAELFMSDRDRDAPDFRP
jgi:dTDP-4-dehydrorhamnose 3,5-epimerase